MSWSPALLTAGALAVVAAFAPVTGQEPQPDEDGPRACELVRNQWVFIRTLGENNRNTYVSGPLEARCDGGVRIQADSAVIYESSGYTQLFGNVMFEDAEKRLTSDRANYFSQDRRLIALGQGRVVDKVRQSVITGDTVVYARARPPFRPRDILNVHGGDPHAILFPPERPPEPSDSTESDAGGEGATADSTALAEGPQGVAVDSTALAEETQDVAVDSLAQGPDQNQVPDSLVAPEQGRGVPVDSLPDTTGISAPPAVARVVRRTAYNVDARSFSIAGDRDFTAQGDVVIRRDSLDAFGDSLRFDQLLGDIVLTGNARIEEAAFDLTGNEVRLGENAEGAQEVRAVGDAVLLGDQVDLTAPEIRIRLADGALDVLVAVSEARVATGAGELPPDAQSAAPQRGGRAVPSAPAPITAGTSQTDSLEADTGPTQPRAVTEDFVLTGDSIEVIAPGERLESVTAVGMARGESAARDSLNTEDTPEVSRRDWLEGQKITAYFVAVEPNSLPTDSADAGPGVRIDKIVAQGNARSLYRMSPSDSAGGSQPGLLAVHYVLGDTITLTLSGGALEGMDVRGSVRGYHLEPLTVADAPADSVAADSTSEADSLPDTAAAGMDPDTTRVGDNAIPVQPGATLSARPRHRRGPVPWPLDPPWTRPRERA